MTKQITYSTYSKIVYSTPVHRKITYTTSHIVYRVSFTKEGKRVSYQSVQKKGKG